MDKRTDRRMDGQTDDPNTSRYPRQTFQAGGIKTTKDIVAGLQSKFQNLNTKVNIKVNIRQYQGRIALQSG